MKHRIGVLVENHFGVLTRIAGLFFSRGYNINSLAVGETEDPTVSRMTIVVDGDERILEQIMKQLDRLIEVIKVIDFNKEDTIDRELALIKVAITPATRPEVMQIINTFRAKVVDVNPKSLIIEMTGSQGKIDAMVELMEQYGVLEVVNTGVVAIARNSILSVKNAEGSVPQAVEPTPQKRTKGTAGPTVKGKSATKKTLKKNLSKSKK